MIDASTVLGLLVATVLATWSISLFQRSWHYLATVLVLAVSIGVTFVVGIG
jgi:hypothetical protein